MHESGVMLLSLVQSTSSLFFFYRCWWFPAFIRPSLMTVSTAARDTFLWAPSPKGIGSDGRHSSHSRLLPVNTGWVFKVVSDRTFSRNSALTHPASHLACCRSGSLFVFDVPLWMQIFSNSGLEAEAGASHVHAPLPRPLDTVFWFVVLCNRFSRVGGVKNNTGENILLCPFPFLFATPRVKWVRSHVGTFLKNTVFTRSILVTNTRHTREAYPPWSGRKRLTCTCNNRAME